MSKGLEALKEARNFRHEKDKNLVVIDIDYFNRCLDGIETTLKNYELLKERTKLDSFECLLRLEEILPRGKELLIPVAKELKRKQDLEQMLHKMNVKHGYEEYLKISKTLEILKAFGFEIEDYTEDEHGSIKVKCNRIILDDEEIDTAKEVLL